MSQKNGGTARSAKAYGRAVGMSIKRNESEVLFDQVFGGAAPAPPLPERSHSAPSCSNVTAAPREAESCGNLSHSVGGMQINPGTISSSSTEVIPMPDSVFKKPQAQAPRVSPKRPPEKIVEIVAGQIAQAKRQKVVAAKVETGPDVKAEPAPEKVQKKPPTKVVYRHNWNANSNGGASGSGTGDPFDIDAEPDIKNTEKRATVDTVPHNQRILQTQQRFARNKLVVSQKAASGTGNQLEDVRDAYECMERGKIQQFRDDCEYILENLLEAKGDVKRGTLCMLGLARKCLSSEFRAYIRAHGYTSKVTSLLNSKFDVNDACLGLSTALCLYLLARDRIGIELESSVVELVVKLLQTDGGEVKDKSGKDHLANSGTPYARCMDRCWQILDKWHKDAQRLLANSSFATKLQFVFEVTQDNISPDFLALEALTFMCGRYKQRDWFRNELRVHTGLQTVVELLVEQCATLPADAKSPDASKWFSGSTSCLKLERCLRILEALSATDGANQNFIVCHRQGAAIYSCARIISLVSQVVTDLAERNDNYDEEESNLDKLLVALKLALGVTLNLSNCNELCCVRLCSTTGFLETVVSCITVVAPDAVPAHQRFELFVMVCLETLCLLCNVCEQVAPARKQVLRMPSPGGRHESVLAALADLFTKHETAAARMEEEIDQALDFDEICDAQVEQKAAAAEESDDESGDSDGSDEMTPTSPEMRQAARARRRAEKKQKSNQNADDDECPAGNLAENETGVVLDTDQQICGSRLVEQLHEKARVEMEDAIIACYVGLAIGCLVQSAPDAYVEQLLGLLSNQGLSTMINRLEQFLFFMERVAHIVNEQTGSKSIKKIIASLKDLQEEADHKAGMISPPAVSQ